MLSYRPQLWHCSSGRRLPNNTICSWRGAYAVHFGFRAEPGSIEYFEPSIFDAHPTCPRCSGHRFKVQDLPVPKSPEWHKNLTEE